MYAIPFIKLNNLSTTYVLNTAYIKRRGTKIHKITSENENCVHCILQPQKTSFQFVSFFIFIKNDKKWRQKKRMFIVNKHEKYLNRKDIENRRQRKHEFRLMYTEIAGHKSLTQHKYLRKVLFCIFHFCVLCQFAPVTDWMKRFPFKNNKTNNQKCQFKKWI